MAKISKYRWGHPSTQLGGVKTATVEKKEVTLRNKEVIVFGESRFAISCMSHMLEHGWAIRGVVSRDQSVISWCEMYKISCYPINRIYEINIIHCYLFSIVNPYLIPDKFIKQVNPIKAINYHDSLLPKYAGLNSTTWAILNGEMTHGVTWHEISIGIDEGDIYYQHEVNIDKQDTAFELNLKCMQAARIGFVEIVDRIEKNTLFGVKQDLSKRSYFGMDSIPNNYGLVSLNTNNSYLNLLLNSLNFGKDYYNSVATVKVKIADEYYIIEDNSAYQEVKTLNLKELPILSIYGKNLKTKPEVKCIADCTLSKEELIFFKKLKRLEFKLVNKINNLFYNRDLINQGDNFIVSDPKAEYEITTQISFNKLCVFLRIILNQLHQDASFIKVYHKHNECDLPLTDTIKNTTENISILSLKPEISGWFFNELCEETFSELNDQFELTKDFGYRYKLNLCSESAVVKDYSGPVDEHATIFFIEDEKLRVSYSKNNHDLLKCIISSIEVLAGLETKLVNTPILVGRISLLSKVDHENVVSAWNNTDVVYPKNKTIHGMFEEQVARTPDNIAVIEHDNTSYTYKDLYTDAKLLAKQIVANESQHLAGHTSLEQSRLGPNLGGMKLLFLKSSLIAVLSEKGYNQVVSTLGIMQSGHGYLPLNSDWPIDRIVDILRSGQVKQVLLSKRQALNKQLYATLSQNFEILVIEDILSALRSGAKFSPEICAIQLPQVSSTDIAYVIFTSGSTGKPKGVTISHHGALNTIYAVNKEFKINESDKVLALSELSFDLSVYDIFGLLCVGGAIVFPDPQQLKNSKHWLELLEEYAITVWNTVPQLANLLIDVASTCDKLNIKVRLFLLSGDWIPLQLPDRIKNFCPRSAIISLGGATEGSIWSIWHKVDNVCQEWSSIPYGIAMPNQKIYILNQALNASPIGAIGDIYIGGSGVALNYWNDPEKTTASFISHPDLGRLYRTGDCGRWNQNGYVEFIGRNDFQVKVRGFRVELGEIESSLSSYPEVKQSVVLALEQKARNLSAKNKYLVAYYVAENKLDEEAIHKHLAATLPEYMLPSVLVYLAKLPLTLNGKLDRSALPEAEFTSQHNYVAPLSELEETLCQIWSGILAIERIGIQDDFFRIGGNSILAIKLAHQISKDFSQHIAVADIFKHKTIKNLAAHLEGASHNHITIEEVSLDKYPLSFAQERLWFIEQYEDGTSAYHLPVLLEVAKNVNVELIKHSLVSIVQRHAILRTIFVQDSDGNYYQQIKEAPLLINEYFYGLPAQAELNLQIAKDVNSPFELTQDYPIRVCVYYLEGLTSQENGRVLLLINTHHVASDGWSIDVLLSEIHAHYRHLKDKSAVLNLAPLTIQYKDFAYWQRQYLSGKVLDEQLAYWQNQLANYELLLLPTDKLRPKEIDYSGSGVNFNLGEELSLKLRALAKEHGCSLYAVLLSGFYVLLAKYTNQEDLVIGTPTANRHFSQIEGLIGFFVNSLAVRAKLDLASPIANLISQVHTTLIGLQSHQDLPFEKLVAHLQVEKDSSRHPIFQVMFGVQSFGSSQQSEDKLLSILPLEEDFYKVAKFDLECFMNDAETSITGTFNYATALYEEPTIVRMVEHYVLILTQLVTNPTMAIREYKILIASEYQTIVYDWNNTDKPYSTDKTLHQLFAEQVERTPDNVALVFAGKSLTYRELNTRANQLAHKLRQTYASQTGEELQPDTLIALFLDRSLEMLIGIFAILKAGGAYVPLDPAYPEDRVGYILGDTQTRIVLIQGRHIARLTGLLDNSASIRMLDISDDDIYQHLPATQPATNTHANNLAYVIYTSGTTGRPKGVMIEHKAFSGFVLGYIDNPCLSALASLNFLSLTNYVFDIFALEYGLPLLSGSYIQLQNSLDLSNVDLADIDIIQQTPSTLQVLCDNSKLDKLKDIICFVGGEALTTSLGSKLLNTFAAVINAYGPTESTVCATLHHYSLGDLNTNIGKPLSNLKAYVLDANLGIVPIGVIGELYLAGAGLARGYLNNPQLTAERFIANPFATASDLANGYTRMYKTGDLVRWLADGNLEYIGRNDFQVKIRGFRIELGEVEEQLLRIPGVKQACVLTRAKANSAQQSLVAYYVLDNGIVWIKN